MQPEDGPSAARRTLIDTLVLMLVCAVAYGFGLRRRGLATGHEGTRALVAKEMYESGDWLVPTAFGVPYLSKPQLFYWIQMVIARVREALGGAPFSDELEIRLTVALGGLAGVLATYFVARRLLACRDAAFWSALGLATGVLYARAARMGEIDIWLAPFVAVAVGAIHRAWERWSGTGRVAWGPLLLATAAASAGTMTKGPPAVLFIAAATYLVLLINGAFTPEEPVATRGVGARRIRAVEAAAALLGAAALPALSRPPGDPLSQFFGIVFFALVGAGTGLTLARLLRRGAAHRVARSMVATQPWITLGVPLIVLALAALAVRERVGAEEVRRVADAELVDNLRLLVRESPARNLGFVAYGLGPMSAACLIGLAWIARSRPRLTMGQWMAVGWAALGFVALSTLGRGASRYLTPVWPGMAMVGGLWFARFLAERPDPSAARRAAVAAGAMAAALTLGMAVWYGAGEWERERSPRAWVREVRTLLPMEDAGLFAMREHPIAYYWGGVLPVWRTESLGELTERIRRSPGGYTLITREETPEVAERFGAPLSALRAEGFIVETVAARSSYRLGDRGPSVVAARIYPPPSR